MSKISVFKFDITNNEQDISSINSMIQNYLNTRGFYYNNEKYCYTTGKPTKKDEATNTALSVGTSIASSVITGENAANIFYSVQHGFEYYIVGNQLVIKAYLLNKNSKSFIHSAFNNSQEGAYYYGDLRGSLFKELKKNNITLINKKVEKINDGSEKKDIKNYINIYINNAWSRCFSIFIFIFFITK